LVNMINHSHHFIWSFLDLILLKRYSFLLRDLEIGIAI
jgi:hypothetical protein